MQEILQKDFNNKKRFLQQGLQKQQKPHEQPPEQVEAQEGSSLYMDRDEYSRRQAPAQANRVNTRSQQAGKTNTSQIQQYNQPAGKASSGSKYQASATARRASSNSRGVASAMSASDTGTDSDATGDLSVTGSNNGEKPRAVSASLISQLQTTYQNISGKVVKGKKGQAGGEKQQTGTSMHLRSGNSSTMMMNSGSNVILKSSQRPSSEQFP